MSRFESIEMAPAVEAFALTKLFNEDACQEKVNLSVGAYRDEAGSPWVFPIVRECFLKLATSKTYNFEYLPILGIEEFSKLTSELLLGEDNPKIKEGKVFGVQSLSGTGALTLGAHFLHRLGCSIVYISSPTWDNHRAIFLGCGFKEVRTYRYWNPKTCSVDFQGYIEDLQNAPENSVIVLHACAHNPTGSDPTKEQWTILADIIQAKNLFPFFDCAYQGFASGDPDNDAWSVRLFVERGMELFVAQSFAKNFGLYNERVGNLTVVVKEPSVIARMKSLFTIIVRSTYSNPPAQGAQIVRAILKEQQSKEIWLESIKTMANRIAAMRKKLREILEELKTPGSWNHITEQIGMFSYTGLTPTQVEHLVKDYHIYLLHTGRISMAGVNYQNVNYLAKAIDAVVRKYPKL